MKNSKKETQMSDLKPCPFCGNTYEGSGYDDTNFHQNVVPDMKCKKCGKSSNSEPQENPRPLTTKYPDHMEV